MADFGIKKARKSNFSSEEVDALVNTVGKHHHILYGEDSKRAVNKQARHKVWLDVTRQVNRVSFEKRTLQEVKNKWKKCQHLLYREQESLDDFVLPNVWEPLTGIEDSMPLEQRLKNSPEQEPVLQSQPLSPTKLKVTRQSAKPPQPSPKPPTPELPNEEVCLRWNSHHVNMQSSFPNLLLKEQYVDTTLVADGQTLKCHRLILSSCSPYFEQVLSGISPFQHPVLFMKDIPFWVLKSLCDFMYAGEVHIFQNKLEELLAVAETLKIKGLAGKTDNSSEEVKTTETSKNVKEEKEGKDKKRSNVSELTPKITSKTVRSVHPKKVERTSKEPLSKGGILDPLDLLQPVYEEVTKDSMPPTRVREVKSVPVKKGKLKKRKFSEEREASPPPLFRSRKGTRSRPNVKIPKYYHTHYERLPESTIVREPHTNQSDPLLQPEEIKIEPLDAEDNVIEIEDNIVGYSDVAAEMHPPEEEIIANYDSPLFNVNANNDKASKEEDSTFSKISLIPQPILMNIHSITEKPSNTVQIVDIAQLKNSVEVLHKTDDPLATEVQENSRVEVAEDPLNFNIESSQKTTDNITISNVQSIAEEEKKDSNVDHTDTDTKDSEPRTHRDEKEREKEEPIQHDYHNETTEGNSETLNTHNDTPEVGLDHHDIANNETVNEAQNNDCEISNIEENVPNIEPSCLEKDSNIEKTTSGKDEIADTTNIITNTNETGDTTDVIGTELDLNLTSDQLSLVDETVMVSEDCARDLGFQITNVVSGNQVEEMEEEIVKNITTVQQETSSDDLVNFPNQVEEIEQEIVKNITTLQQETSSDDLVNFPNQVEEMEQEIVNNITTLQQETSSDDLVNFPNQVEDMEQEIVNNVMSQQEIINSDFESLSNQVKGTGQEIVDSAMSQQASSSVALETFSNHVSEVESEVINNDEVPNIAPSIVSELVVEDTQLLAETLEKLLEK